MSDDTEPAAAPKRQTEPPKPARPRVEDAPTPAPEPVAEPVQTNYSPFTEGHVLEDLINASTVLLGVLPEVVSGAAHKAGWEMTQTVTVEQAKQAISTFLATPAKS